VLANNGLFEHDLTYLKECRNLSEENCSLLIFDEVITGFRLGLGGAKNTYGIEPDLGTYGKVIGGGMPIGAIAGPSKFMDQLAPIGPIYQAGTLSGNPVAMASGLETLRTMRSENFYQRIKEVGRYFDQCLLNIQTIRPNIELNFKRIDSIFWLSFGGAIPPSGPNEITEQHAKNYAQVYHHLINNGVYMAPSAYEVGFLSLAHTHNEVDKLASTLESYEPKGD